MRKLLIAGVAAVAVLGGGVYVASQYGWQTLLHPGDLLPTASIHNAETDRLEKKITDAEAELAKRKAEFAPMDSARQQRGLREKELYQQRVAMFRGFFQRPDPRQKQVDAERTKLIAEDQRTLWSYSLVKFKVAAKAKDIAELHVQLLTAQQGPGNLSIPAMKQMLAIRAAALKVYEQYVDALGSLHGQLATKRFMLKDTLSYGPRFIGAERYAKAKHAYEIIDAAFLKFDSALDKAQKTLKTKRQEVAALQEAVMTPEERQRRDQLRAMMMRELAKGMANAPGFDFEHVMPRYFAHCESDNGEYVSSVTGSGTTGSSCQMQNGSQVIQGHIADN